MQKLGWLLHLKHPKMKWVTLIFISLNSESQNTVNQSSPQLKNTFAVLYILPAILAIGSFQSNK